MPTRVTVLGGSAAAPNPGQPCSGYLVETDHTRLLLDCGPGVLPTLRQFADFRSLDAVLISHTHADHTIDLVPFRYALRHAPGARGPRIPLFLPPGGEGFLKRVALAFASRDEDADGFFRDVFAVSEYATDATVMIGDTRVTFRPTRHSVPCWAMVVNTDDGGIVYLADTGPMDELVGYAQHADLLIAEGTYLEYGDCVPVSEQIHLTAADAGRIAAASGAGELLLTHLWWENDLERCRIEAEATYGGPLTVARPGVRLTIEQGTGE